MVAPMIYVSAVPACIMVFSVCDVLDRKEIHAENIILFKMILP